jgi:foldase protein PrsA
VKKLLYLFVAGAVSLAACGSGSGAVAATVNGEDVTVGQIETLVDTGGETVTKEQFAQFLAFQIQWLILDAAAKADYDIEPTEDEIAAEADRIYNQVATEGQSREEFLASNGVTEEFLQNIARQGVLDTGIQDVMREDVPEPTPDEIEAQRQLAIASLTNACVSHILVATEAEAQDVMTRLDNGEDFADLATELSTDTATAPDGGALGCAAPSNYVESFRDAVLKAPVGEVYDQIVQSNFGFHVIMVTERDEPAEEDLPTEEELISTVKDNDVLNELNDWFLGVVGDAEVTVAEEYGTWDPSTPTVVPPSS